MYAHSPTGSEILSTGEDFSREKYPIMEGLCTSFDNNPNCYVCQTKPKDKVNCEFCGKVVCKMCIAKKRKNPKTYDTWHKICRKCETIYLTMQIHADFKKQRQQKQQELQDEERKLETIREVLFDLKSNIDRSTQSHREKTQQLINQEQEAAQQIEDLKHQIDQAQYQKEAFEAKINKADEEATQLQIELNSTLHDYNHEQFEIQRIQQLLEITQEKIEETQYKLENNIQDEDRVQPTKQLLASEIEAGSSGYDSIFRESSQQNLDRSRSLAARQPQTLQRHDSKDCVIF